MMVGRPVLLTVDKGVAAPGESVLQVDSLCVVDERGQVVVDDVSFSVRSGEIYAVAGVQGNGQSELTESLIGLTRPTSGRILIDGDDVARESIDEILARGVGYVPEDRKTQGLFLDQSGHTTGWWGASPSRRTWSWTSLTRRRLPTGCPWI